MSYREIAEELDTTISSVKHKYLRLKQKYNEDEHHHPIEKIEQVKKFIEGGERVLETHAGYGNLTSCYSNYTDNIISLEIKRDKVKKLKEKFDHTIIKCDSEKHFHKFITEGKEFDIIDIDPYGFPSRYFPHILKLLDEDGGFLFLTFPKFGVQCVNKIMQEHYRIFWGINYKEINSEEEYIDAIKSQLMDYSLMMKRAIVEKDRIDLKSVYRFTFYVKRESMLDLCDLTVKGIND